MDSLMSSINSLKVNDLCLSVNPEEFFNSLLSEKDKLEHCGNGRVSHRYF